jgi:hypothetical protein
MKELYLFSDGNVEYPFTPHKLSTLFGGKLYLPTSVTRSGIELTSKLTKSAVTFSFARNNPFAKDVLLYPRDYHIEASIYRDDALFWAGRVLAVKGSGINIDLICDSIHSRFRSTALPKQVGLQCRHTLYSESCGVNEALFSVPFTVIGISSNVITIPTLTNPTGYFDGGKAVINGQIRRITKQVGTTITLEASFKGVISGTLTLSPGCKLSYANCTTFNNTLNFGGFMYHPKKNPFDSAGAI